jgi:heparan sulfate 6-O-sulfotransferase HS6ST1
VLDELEGEPIKRRYFYITLLRDPITRFISEYNHFRVQESNAKASRHWCGGKEVTQMPECDFSSDFTIDDYLDCQNNLAINRQTRMLSDLALIGCYNVSFMPQNERQLVMLTSAKNNLHKMAFFGLNEFPRISQYLFEETFDFMFLDADIHSSHRIKRSLLDDLSTKTIEKIKLINHLDMELYEYAKQLLFDRFGKLKNKNPKLKNLSVSSVAKDNQEIVNWGDSEDQQNV